MKEIVLKIDNVELVEFYGANNQNLKIIQDGFPDLKIVARGQELKVSGDDDNVDIAEGKIIKLMNFAAARRRLPEKYIQDVVLGKEMEVRQEQIEDSLILYGRDKKPIKARTPNQYKLIESVENNDIVFAIGPAGTGKTYTSVALAVRALRNKEVKKIILTRPAVEAGESLGFLPGDMREKIDPYLRPLYDALDDMLPADKMAAHLERKVIEIAPLAFMRGRTLDNAFVILDEAQNCTDLQLKMFLTRMGPSAKFIVTGDLTQIDLPSSQKSGLYNASTILNNIKGIDMIHFTVEDVTRHRIVKDIITAYSKLKKDKY